MGILSGFHNPRQIFNYWFHRCKKLFFKYMIWFLGDKYCRYIKSTSPDVLSCLLYFVDYYDGTDKIKYDRNLKSARNTIKPNIYFHKFQFYFSNFLHSFYTIRSQYMMTHLLSMVSICSYMATRQFIADFTCLIFLFSHLPSKRSYRITADLITRWTRNKFAYSGD